jgi:hypothetical protein
MLACVERQGFEVGKRSPKSQAHRYSSILLQMQHPHKIPWPIKNTVELWVRKALLYQD